MGVPEDVSVCAGGQAGESLKNSREMTLIGEPCSQCNVRYLPIKIRELHTCVLHAKLVYIVANRVLMKLPEDP